METHTGSETSTVTTFGDRFPGIFEYTESWGLLKKLCIIMRHLTGCKASCEQTCKTGMSVCIDSSVPSLFPSFPHLTGWKPPACRVCEEFSWSPNSWNENFWSVALLAFCFCRLLIACDYKGFYFSIVLQLMLNVVKDFSASSTTGIQKYDLNCNDQKQKKKKLKKGNLWGERDEIWS